MLAELLERSVAQGPAAAAELLREHTRVVLASARSGGLGRIADAEEFVTRDPAAAFAFDAAGRASLRVGERTFAAGRFTTPTIGALKTAVARAGQPGRVRLFVLDGATPATDIGALQAFAGEATMFQVASQFYCLEAPGPEVVRVRDYLHDPTQGPRAAISCFPGTLLRHYAAPGDGGRFVQTNEGRQIELLAAVCEPGVARVRGGYLLDRNIAEPIVFAELLERRFDEIMVGIHEELEVVFGYAWDGRVAPGVRVSQAFTSTLAAGGYSDGRLARTDFFRICERLQRAAQLGTILGAAATGARRVVMTLIGGGVFGNPTEVIWEAIAWAADEAARLGAALDVVVNGRNLGQQVDRARLVADTQRRGGAVIEAE
jgi:hypothetical protein